MGSHRLHLSDFLRMHVLGSGALVTNFQQFQADTELVSIMHDQDRPGGCDEARPPFEFGFRLRCLAFLRKFATSAKVQLAVALRTHLVLLGVALLARYPGNFNPAALCNGPTSLTIAENLSFGVTLRRRCLHLGSLWRLACRLRLIELAPNLL